MHAAIGLRRTDRLTLQGQRVVHDQAGPATRLEHRFRRKAEQLRRQARIDDRKVEALLERQIRVGQARDVVERDSAVRTAGEIVASETERVEVLGGDIEPAAAALYLHDEVLGKPIREYLDVESRVGELAVGHRRLRAGTHGREGAR